MNWIAKKEKNNGITLIALVITIIILLILAGVSIATLTGENGLLTKANTAKQQTEEKSAKEKIELAIASSIDTNGNLNVEEFEKEINNLGGTVIEKTEETITVEMDDYEAVIDIKTGQIIKFESTKGVKPEVEADLYQENGSALLPDTSYEKVIITVKITNSANIEKIDEIIVKDKEGNRINKEELVIGSGEASFKVAGTGTYTITVKATTKGVQKETTIEVPIKVAPEGWKITTTADSEWYNYGNSKISGPKLTGEMTPIKYIGEQQDGNKWANAITADGSMWVWIPRYAYKITEGYHSNVTGKIEVAFLDTSNNFLNGETGEVTKETSDEQAGRTKWLVHPAFTSDAKKGGGFGELEGLWVGKFEATGTSSKLSVKPGVTSLCQMKINQQYQLAKTSKFGETATINSHMAKSSEWGATVYLAHSKYGINGQEIEKNENSKSVYVTGGSENKAEIYTTNQKQSSTYNATGIYGLHDGAYENIASYVNNGESSLVNNGGKNSGDLYGATEEERTTNTAYKMVYEKGRSVSNYEAAKKYKGDAIYETSNSQNSNTGSWFSSSSIFPGSTSPFIQRSTHPIGTLGSSFSFSINAGTEYSGHGFRPVLAF